MDELIVNIPQNLSLNDSINFCKRLQDSPPIKSIVLDFIRLKHVEPFTMALISSEIKKYHDEHKR